MNAKRTWSAAEPAERPITVALSCAEVMVLINHHIRVARNIPKKVGVKAMDMALENPFRAGLRSYALFKAARDLLKAHSDRTKELSKLLPK